jgi:uncharacterized membrane protein
MQGVLLWPARVVRGHWRTSLAALVGMVAYAVLPRGITPVTRSVLAWDVGAISMLGLATAMFVKDSDRGEMRVHALRQEEGEWTIFALTLLAVVFSFVALTTQLDSVKDARPGLKDSMVALVAGTLAISWLVTHVVFALRYAHEYYARSAQGGVDGGLQFPEDDAPDYWDFVYFSLVLGMTFQVSDVQITSKKMRRLATVHGVVGFLFNTVIVALTVNIAAGLVN